jgi:TatD DNase family protein
LHDARVTEVDAVWRRAQAAGVDGALLAGVEPDGWRVEAELCARLHGVSASYGIHPQIVAELDDAGLATMLGALEDALARPPGGVAAIAVGEIGLDAARGRKPSLALQEKAFAAQLQLARRAKLPVALHVLDAQARALAVVAAAGPLPEGGVVHSYSGPAELVGDWVALGFSISFAGAVANPRAERPRRAALAVPEAWLLVETDAPDQTPQPCQPAVQNEPANLVANVAALAQIRGRSAAEIATLTATNARRLLRL